MIALRVLLISQVIVILCSPVAYAVPVYGTKKYVRSPVVARPISVWDQDMPSYRQPIRPQRHSTNYPYDTNPYASYYDSYYYHPRDYYPAYYPKTSKYEVYQAVVPYYYNDAHSMEPSYMYDYNSADPIMDIEEDLQRQRAIAERENAQALGQEMFYENDDSAPSEDNMDAINTAFLQNLIMTQIYNDAMDKNRYYPQKTSSEQVYGKWDEYPLVDHHDYYHHSDDDERELKMVANMNGNSVKDEDRLNFFNKGTHPNKKYESKRDEQIKSRKSSTLTTVQPPVKTFRKTEGQKEEVLHRPATPIVHRMSQPQLTNSQDKPSVYDTIKHMLNMEKELETHSGDVKRKRDIRSSEDSLTKQLSLLKKRI